MGLGVSPFHSQLPSYSIVNDSIIGTGKSSTLSVFWKEENFIPITREAFEHAGKEAQIFFKAVYSTLDFNTENIPCCARNGNKSVKISSYQKEYVDTSGKHRPTTQPKYLVSNEEEPVRVVSVQDSRQI